MRMHLAQDLDDRIEANIQHTAVKQSKGVRIPRSHRVVRQCRSFTLQPPFTTTTTTTIRLTVEGIGHPYGSRTPTAKAQDYVVDSPPGTRRHTDTLRPAMLEHGQECIKSARCPRCKSGICTLVDCARCKKKLVCVEHAVPVLAV